MKKFILLIIFTLVSVSIIEHSSSIYAQQPTPTPTATPVAVPITGAWSSDSNCIYNSQTVAQNCYIANPPSLSQFTEDNGLIEAKGFSNVFEYNDALIVLRYRLPVKDLPELNNPGNSPNDWGSTWCDFLENNYGCHIEPASPVFPQQLTNASGITNVGLRVNDYGKPPLILGYCRDISSAYGGPWDNCWDSTINKYSFGKETVYMPRVGYGIVSLYTNSQSSNTILANDQGVSGLNQYRGRVCLYPNKDVWNTVSNTSPSCVDVDWISENNPPVNATDNLVHDEFRSQVLDMMNDLENNVNLGNNKLVTANQKITVLGSTYISQIDRANEVLSPIYEFGANKSITDVHTSSGTLPLQSNIDSDFAATQLKTTFDNVSQYYLGFQGRNTGIWVIVSLLIIIAIGFAYSYVTGVGPGGGRMVLVLALTPVFIFMFVGFPSVAFIVVMVSIFAIFGAYFLFRGVT